MKVKKSVTTTKTIIIAKKEKEEENLKAGVKVEYEGVMKQEIGVRIVRMKREKKSKVEAKDEGNDEGESVKEVGTTAAGTEESERKIEMEIKQEENGDNHAGVKYIATGRGEKVEIINRAPKRILKFEDEEVDIELEEAGMTMADRIKRRRR